MILMTKRTYQPVPAVALDTASLQLYLVSDIAVAPEIFDGYEVVSVPSESVDSATVLILALKLETRSCMGQTGHPRGVNICRKIVFLFFLVMCMARVLTGQSYTSWWTFHPISLSALTPECLSLISSTRVKMPMILCRLVLHTSMSQVRSLESFFCAAE